MHQRGAAIAAASSAASAVSRCNTHHWAAPMPIEKIARGQPVS
jgi:hypothetical protein